MVTMTSSVAKKPPVPTQDSGDGNDEDSEILLRKIRKIEDIVVPHERVVSVQVGWAQVLTELQWKLNAVSS